MNVKISSAVTRIKIAGTVTQSYCALKGLLCHGGHGTGCAEVDRLDAELVRSIGHRLGYSLLIIVDRFKYCIISISEELEVVHA